MFTYCIPNYFLFSAFLKVHWNKCTGQKFIVEIMISIRGIVRYFFTARFIQTNGGKCGDICIIG